VLYKAKDSIQGAPFFALEDRFWLTEDSFKFFLNCPFDAFRPLNHGKWEFDELIQFRKFVWHLVLHLSMLAYLLIYLNRYCRNLSSNTTFSVSIMHGNGFVCLLSRCIDAGISRPLMAVHPIRLLHPRPLWTRSPPRLLRLRLGLFRRTPSDFHTSRRSHRSR
jgi:hypothetical protein